MPKLIAAITAGALAFTISVVSGGVAQAAIALPAAPQITSFSSAKNGSTQSIQVNFVNPNDSSIVGYKYSTDGGSTFESCNSSACDWAGLASGYVVIQKLSSENNSMSYGSTVNILLQACQAGTANTNSLSSCGPNSVIYEVIVGTPDAPTSISATSNADSQSVISWTAPANDGGGAITDYTVQYSSDSGSTWTSFAHTASVATSQIVTGLTNGTSYLFKVAAVNSAGIGNYSATVSATPSTLPGAPATASATSDAYAQSVISWTAPASNGGAAITGYSVTSSPSVTAPASCTNTLNLSCTFTGLSNGTPYTFTVVATNASGTGPGTTAIATPAAPVTQSASITTISCNEGNTYTGSALTPCTASVTGDGLDLTGLTPTYSNNTNAGTATASYTYEGDENYAGSTGSQSFTIAQASSTTTIDCPGKIAYTGSALTPCAASVTGEGLNLTGLTPTYSNNTNAGAATASYTYAGDANYSGSTDSQSFIIAQASSTTTIFCNEGNTYTGSPLTPCTASVTGDGLNLTNLTPTYSNNTNAGTATASYNFVGDDNHEGSSGSTNFTINQRSGNVSYTGTNVLPLGSKINLTASSDFPSYCPNNLFRYEYSSDGTNWSLFAATGLATQSPTTSTLNLLAGTYFIRVVYNENGSGNCARAVSDGSDVLTVYAAGTNAYGGGFYIMNGKANFGFVVQLVPKTTNTYKGQVVWNYKNNWRFKGDLSNFGKGSDTASASGTGTLQYWDPNLVSPGVGGWAIAATNVNVIMKFTATKATTKKSAATTGGFVINFGYATPPGWQFAALPTVNTITALKGGNITYS